MRKQIVNALKGPPPYAVAVERKDGSEVRIGPIEFAHVAEQMAHWFKIDARGSREGARGCAVTIVAYDERREHLPLVPANADAVLMVIEDPVQGSGAPFPDLWDRLCAQHGHAGAKKSWDLALVLMDGAQAEGEAEERDRERREARDAELRAGVLKVLEAYGTSSAGEAVQDIMALVSDVDGKAGVLR
ncbi:hypothetical protein ACFQ6C_25860 [Streptomyces sp. NPDC056454]|uniref:hypothetical protein n=1 Tax=Streptomyces sp. NPDC056454 TaxID=3345823 RepID=UPI0036AC2149